VTANGFYYVANIIRVLSDFVEFLTIENMDMLVFRDVPNSNF